MTKHGVAWNRLLGQRLDRGGVLPPARLDGQVGVTMDQVPAPGGRGSQRTPWRSCRWPSLRRRARRRHSAPSLFVKVIKRAKYADKSDALRGVGTAPRRAAASTPPAARPSSTSASSSSWSSTRSSATRPFTARLRPWPARACPSTAPASTICTGGGAARRLVRAHGRVAFGARDHPRRRDARQAARPGPPLPSSTSSANCTRSRRRPSGAPRSWGRRRRCSRSGRRPAEPRPDWRGVSSPSAAGAGGWRRPARRCARPRPTR